MSVLPTAPKGFPFELSNQPAQPTSSPTPDDSPLFSQFPPSHILDVVIDGETYHLPSSQQSDTKILLLDGTIAQLFANKVIMRGQTLEIPGDITASQEISSGGQSVTAQPGESQEPQSDDKDDGGGGGGGGGLFGALGGLIGIAGSAADSIADVGTGALGLAGAAGGAAGGVAAGLVGTFGAASKNAGGLVSSLNGIQKAFPVADLAKTGLDSILQAQNLGRDAVNWAKSMGEMVQGWDGLGADQQQNVRNNIQEYAGPNGPLKQAEQAMRDFSEFPWNEQELPTQTSTGSKTLGGTQTQGIATSVQATNSVSLQNSQGLTSVQSLSATGTTTTISSSISASASSSPSDTPVTYFLQTKGGTSLETFDKFIQDLDGGVGQSFTYDMELVDHQNYMTKLNSSQVASLEKDYDFILAYHPCVTDPIDLHSDEEFHAIPKSGPFLPTHLGVQLEQPSKLPKSLSGPRPVDVAHSSSRDSFAHLQSRKLNPPVSDAPYWLKMISSPPVNPLELPSQDPPFLADESGGRGTTIYVIDDGFDISSEVRGQSHNFSNVLI
jgi:hypothetical protein